MSNVPAGMLNITWEEVLQNPFFLLCLSFLSTCRYALSDTTPIVSCTGCLKDYCYKDKVMWTDDHICEKYGTFEGGKLPDNVRGCPKCKFHVSSYPYAPHLTLIRDCHKTAH